MFVPCHPSHYRHCHAWQQIIPISCIHSTVGQGKNGDQVHPNALLHHLVVSTFSIIRQMACTLPSQFQRDSRRRTSAVGQNQARQLCARWVSTSNQMLFETLEGVLIFGRDPPFSGLPPRSHSADSTEPRHLAEAFKRLPDRPRFPLTRVPKKGAVSK